MLKGELSRAWVSGKKKETHGHIRVGEQKGCTASGEERQGHSDASDRGVLRLCLSEKSGFSKKKSILGWTERSWEGGS